MEIDPKVVVSFLSGAIKVAEWIVHHASGHPHHDEDKIKDLAREMVKAALDRANDERVRREFQLALDTLDDAIQKCSDEMKRLDALMPKPLPLTDDGRE